MGRKEKEGKGRKKKKKIRNCACISNARLKETVGYWLCFLFYFFCRIY